jgi:phospho-N-acetylmuramoyl-pentapeptide-transferase
MIIDIVKLFIPFTLAFTIGVAFTPILTNYLYKNEMWKKKSGKVDLSGSATPIFNELHKHKEVGTPKMGGVVVWVSVFLTALLLMLLSHILGGETFSKLDFISRNQTWIPLAVLIVGSLFGLIDDYLEVKGGGDHIAGGLSLKKRLLIVGTIGLLCALWFYYKLGVASIGLPVLGDWYLGIAFIPLFVLVVIGIYSGGVIDGIDGLSGGIFSAMFAAYAGIAYYQNQINLAAFCLVVVGGILAFLWFNIPPARFYMSETGMMGLTITLAVVAFMTDSLGGGHGLIVLPVIALPLIVTTLSDIIQVTSKKLRGKKVFLVAPIHHHFEAIGWPPYKVVMRFWIVGVVFAILGMALALIG